MLAPRFKICRQVKENVWHKRLNPRKRALIWGFPFRKELRKKPFKRRRSENFSEKLQTIRKLSLFYGLPMKRKIQNIKPLIRNIRRRNINFLPFLEKRLDVILVRISFCKHIFQARQLIRHKHIYVNSKIINIPGFIVSRGDLISIKEASKPLIESNITQYREGKERIRKSIKQLKRVKRPFLRPLFYPFIHEIYIIPSTPRIRNPIHRNHSHRFTEFFAKNKKFDPLFSEIKQQKVLFHYLDLHYPHYLEVEYKELNVVVFDDPPYDHIELPYRNIEKHAII